MAQRRPQHRGSHAPAFESRRYPARRSPPHKRVSSHTPPSDNRPVLVPLHPNLRRLPSRALDLDKDFEMAKLGHGHSDSKTGVKRKRVASRNENVNGSGRGSLKRLRSVSSECHRDSSDETDCSAMEVDQYSDSAESNEPDAEDGDEDESDLDSTDDHLINEAPASQLLRLRKDELIRLYTSAGLLENAEALTKHDLVEAIIDAREDIAELPPSSPPRGDGDSSDGSSDDGNFGGDEETDFSPRRSSSSLRRRATINDVGRLSSAPLQKRSLSLGHFVGGDLSVFPIRNDTKSSHRSSAHDSRRRTASQMSVDFTSYVNQSPPAAHTRSRKVSAPSTQPAHPLTPISSTSTSRTRLSKGKGKAKQVEFSDDVVKPKSRSKKHSEGRGETSQGQEMTIDFDSDLTELEDDCLPVPQPSPRRLRSNGRPSSSKSGTSSHDTKQRHASQDSTRRITPSRKAKVSGSKDGIDQEVSDEDDDAGVDGLEDEVDTDDEADAEVDQLASNPSSASLPRGRRTPVKRRLRPRRVQTFTPPSDGDDEGSGGAEEDEEAEEVEEVEEQIDDDETIADDDSADIVDEPRRLRNGKIVGDEEPDMDVEEDIGEEDEETPDEEEEEAEEEEEEASDIIEDNEDPEADAEGETDEEPNDDEVDLTVATAKTLVRLRRDDLVRLCESRDLEPVGTKSQLAEALLQWRDCRGNGFSSPSSTGTARPPSTIKRRRHGKTSAQDPTTPVLLRSDRVHLDEPRTPPISKDVVKEHEPELELDLESLGLEDREIPYDKLTKLEKIGSGGFKDVFVGKLKGRRIAIAEFRGQLSAMDIKELKLLGGFNHPNIVRFLGVSIPDNTKETPVMILSELCSNGDLFDYVRNVSPPTLHKVLSIMLDIARGLEYLHLRKPSVIHRDCKSSNILITSKGIAKIADFGLAKVKQSTRSMVRSLVGTVNWQAPELWTAHPKYNHKVDVFSCSMVFWEMLQWHVPNKKFPWEGMNEHAIYEAVGAKRQRPSIAGLKKQWCPEIVDLMEQMWAQEHQDRPTMSQVVQRLEELFQKY